MLHCGGTFDGFEGQYDLHGFCIMYFWRFLTGKAGMVNFGACIVKFLFFRHTIYNARSPRGQGRLKRNLN